MLFGDLWISIAIYLLIDQLYQISSVVFPVSSALQIGCPHYSFLIYPFGIQFAALFKSLDGATDSLTGRNLNCLICLLLRPLKWPTEDESAPRISYEPCICADPAHSSEVTNARLQWAPSLSWPLIGHSSKKCNISTFFCLRPRIEEVGKWRQYARRAEVGGS